MGRRSARAREWHDAILRPHLALACALGVWACADLPPHPDPMPSPQLIRLSRPYGDPERVDIIGLPGAVTSAGTVTVDIPGLATDSREVSSTANGTFFARVESRGQRRFNVRFNRGRAASIELAEPSVALEPPQVHEILSGPSRGQVTVTGSGGRDSGVIAANIRSGDVGSARTAGDGRFAIALAANPGDPIAVYADRADGSAVSAPLQVAVSPLATLDWVRVFGGTRDDWVLALAVDLDGNSFVGGQFAGRATFAGRALGLDGTPDARAFVASYGAAGEDRWAIDSGGQASAFCNGLDVNASGTVAVSGGFVGMVDFGSGLLVSDGEGDVLLAALSAESGDSLWSRRFGGAGDDSGKNVRWMGERIYLTGRTGDQTDFGGGPLTARGFRDMFVAAFEPDGTHVLSFGRGGDDQEQGFGVAADAARNVYVSGHFRNVTDLGGGPLDGPDQEQIFVVSYGPSGAFRWARAIPSGNDVTGSIDLVATSEGIVYVAGHIASSFDFGGGLRQVKGGRDAFVASFDADGRHRWSRVFGDVEDDRGYGLALDAADNVYLAGEFRGQLTLDGVPLRSAGGSDALVASFDAAGALRWARRFGGAGDEIGYRVAAGRAGAVWLAGRFRGEARFEGTTHTSQQNDGFLLKLTEGGE